MRLILDVGDMKYELHECYGVAYDGCHKLYLITTPDESREAIEYGYEIHPVTNLPKLWDESCSLRFLQFWDVENIKAHLIKQFEDAIIELDGVNVVITPANPDEHDIDELISIGQLVVYTGN